MRNSTSIYHLEVILDAIHDGIIAIDKQGRVVQINQAAAELVGAAKTRLSASTLSRSYPIPGCGGCWNGEPEINRQQELGDNTVLLSSRIPVRDGTGQIIGAVAVFRDISDIRKLAEEITDLKEIRSLLEAIINATRMPFPLWTKRAGES